MIVRLANKASARLTGARSTECSACHGIGYTYHTEAEMQMREERTVEWRRRRTEYYQVERMRVVEAKTLKQGSGCPACQGTGQC